MFRGRAGGLPMVRPLKKVILRFSNGKKAERGKFGNQVYSSRSARPLSRPLRKELFFASSLTDSGSSHKVAAGIF